MKFADVLTSALNSVKLKRKAWHDGEYVTAQLTDAHGEHYVFTVDDDRADDWQIVMPKPKRDPNWKPEGR